MTDFGGGAYGGEPGGPGPVQQHPRAHMRPHRGGTVLALGILGLVVCFICGIFAWIMGNEDLRAMRAGQMDPSGEGITQAGRICGMVSVILVCVAVFIWVVVLGGMAVSL